jgi:hypothetical protein
MVDLLLRHGADPGATGPVTASPLFLAALTGTAACMRSLVRAGADVNVGAAGAGDGARSPLLAMASVTSLPG